MLNALDQLEANWQRILASRQNTLLSARLLEAQQRQFKLDLGTATDVLETQANFADAKTSEINSIVEYQIALIDLAYATGTVMGSSKIDWAPITP